MLNESQYRLPHTFRVEWVEIGQENICWGDYHGFWFGQRNQE